MASTDERTGSDDSAVVRAFDVASSYDLKAVRDLVERELGGRILSANPLLAGLEGRQMIGVFEYGSLVTLDLSETRAQALLNHLDRCAQRPNKDTITDEFVLHIGSDERRPVGTEELHVRELNRDTGLLVAVVLSRSVALEYYERLVADALAHLEQTIGFLASKGKIPRGARDITKQVGLAMLVEHELAVSLAAFDEPEIVWDGGQSIGALYVDLKREFDLDDRVRILQQKIALISRWSTFIISRLEGRRAQMLEATIILLIVAEIVLALVGKLH